MELRLLVIRTANTEPIIAFYTLLGFSFHYHQHGNSPYHYSATVGQTVVEIYPLTKSQQEADKHLRLGFAIDNFETIINTLKEQGTNVTEAVQTDFGYMTVATDPDGRKVELYKK